MNRWSWPCRQTSTKPAWALTTARTWLPSTTASSTWSAALSWRSGMPSTVPALRSTHTSRSSSTSVAAGGPPRRKPSAWKGWPVSREASIAAIQAPSARGRSASGAGSSWWSSQAVSMVASRNSSLSTSARRKPALVVRPEDRGGVERLDQRAPGGLAVGSVRDHLAEHGVVRRGDGLPGLEGVVDADAVSPPAGHRTMLAVPACGRKPPKLSSAYTRASIAWPSRRTSCLGEAERLAGRDAELELDEVEAGHGLGDRVLDLEAGVHLEEVELAGVVVEQELHGAGVGVADVAGEVDGRGGDRGALLVGERRRGRLLEHLLVPALGRAVALVEVEHGAVVVADHLHLDVAAALDVLLDEHGVVAEGAQRLALRGGDRLVHLVAAERTTRMPLPPPPAAALTSTGKPGVVESRRARRARRRRRRARGRRPCGPSAP